MFDIFGIRNRYTYLLEFVQGNNFFDFTMMYGIFKFILNIFYTAVSIVTPLRGIYSKSIIQQSGNLSDTILNID